jgi:hypothetical protein
MDTLTAINHGKMIQDWLKGSLQGNVAITIQPNQSHYSPQMLQTLLTHAHAAVEAIAFGGKDRPKEPYLVWVMETSPSGKPHAHAIANIRSHKRLVRVLEKAHGALFRVTHRFVQQHCKQPKIPSVQVLPMTTEDAKKWHSYINKDGFRDLIGDRFFFG